MSCLPPDDVATVAESIFRAVGLRSVSPVDRDRVHRLLLHWSLQILEQPANRLLELRDQATKAEGRSRTARPE